MAGTTDLICDLVFDYYEARITMGIYKYGDKLPAMPRIGQSFRMAPRTVKAAFERLEEKGYIEITHRKPSKVIYQADSGQLRKNAAMYFVPRIEGIVDFCLAGKMLVEPVWEYAYGRLDKEACSEIKKMLIQDGQLKLSLSTRLHIYVFYTLQNKLIMNFYWELLRYIRFPYLAGSDIHLSRDRELLLGAVEKEIAYMNREFASDFENGIERLISFCSEAEKEYHLEKEEKIPFRWSVYRQRPQLCYTLVSRIIIDIIKGIYPPGTKLPAAREMSKQLGAAYRTLRRALSIMGSLGLIRSSQGKVSEVCAEIEEIDFTRPEVKEGFRLYRESLQYMALTISRVFLFTVQNVGMKEKEFLKKEFVRISKQREEYRCFRLLMDFIAANSPSAAVRECYGRLSEFLTWGYPFFLYRAGRQRLVGEYAQPVSEISGLLEKEAWEDLAVYLQKMMEGERKKAEDFFAAYGI